MASTPNNAPQRILRLALPSPLRRLFDYLAPAHWTDAQLEAGVRIRVSFGRREMIGILMEVVEHSEVPSDKLKFATALLDDAPLFNPQLLQLCRWCAQYYHHSLGDTFSIALPALLRQGQSPQPKEQEFWSLSAPLSSEDSYRLKRAPKQLEAAELLAQHPKGLSKPLLAGFSIATGTLRNLLEKGLVKREMRCVKPTSKAATNLLKEAPLHLSPDQQHAVDSINSSTGYQCFLLEGVTGSGKTEVYLHAIEHCLKEGKQALVLVPEIGLTPQTLQRFEQRFNVPVCVLHSGLNDRQRLDAWVSAQSAEAGIIIGTRSAVFTPMSKPGVIIIDEEHDNSYKQQDSLRYNARDLAIYRAHLEGISIVLGSATPCLESLHNHQQQRSIRLPLPQRAGKAQALQFECLDIRQKPLHGGVSQELAAQMQEHLQKGNQVLLFLNRRGFSPTLLCHSCGWVADCFNCDAKMTLHLNPAHLHCHHCDTQCAIPPSCPHCGLNELKPVGHGTERCEDELSRLFPKTEIIRIDRDSVRNKGAMEKALQRIHQGSSAILLGTQMLAKGHHFPNVTLVGILNADSGLFSTDFRGLEKMAQLLIQVSGRAGREDKPGKVVIQTHNPDHPELLQMIHQGYSALAANQMRERKALQLPPFAHLALLRCEAAQAERADGFLHEAKKFALQFGQELNLLGPQGVRLLGPIAAPMQRRQGRFRSQLLLSSTQRAPLHHLLHCLITHLENNRSQQGQLRWSIDVDPQDMS